MDHSTPNMAFGILLVAVLGMLSLAALISMVVGLVLGATKGGRILLGIGAVSLLGLFVVGGGLFTVLGFRTTTVIPSSANQVNEVSLETRAAPLWEIPLGMELIPEEPTQEATPQPQPETETQPDTESQPETPESKEDTEESQEPPAEASASGTPARTLSAAPEYPFPDMRPPHFSRPFGPYGPGFQGGYASTDPHEEIRKLRDQAMSRMQEQLYGMPAASSAEEETAEESHAPVDSAEETSSIIPPGRPAWVEQAPQWEDDGTYLVAVSSGPFERGMDCRKILENETKIALRQFANDYLDNPQAAERLGSQLDSLQEDVTIDTYHEQLNASVGPMQQWHSLLKFDIPIQQKLGELWQAQQQVSRVVYIGAGFFGLLGLLSIFYIGMSLTSEGSKVSPWLVSAGTVVALGGLLVAGVIFVQAFPML